MVVLLFLLTACQNTAKEELLSHIEFIEENEDAVFRVSEDAEKYVELVRDGKALEGFELLGEEVIPKYESFLESFDELDYTHELVKELVEHQRNTLAFQLESLVLIYENFKLIKEAIETDQFNEEDLHSSETIANYILDIREEAQKFDTKLEAFLEEEVQMSEEEIKEFFKAHAVEVDITDEELIRQVDEMMYTFYQGLIGELEVDDAKPDLMTEYSVETANVLEDMLEDIGNPYVVIDAEAEFDEDLIIRGKTNLPEGAEVVLHSSVFGYDNPYIQSEAEIEADHTFEIEIPMVEEEYTGEPIVLQLIFAPDSHVDEGIHMLYGPEGEEITGPFKQKYTNIKRTRIGAISVAELRLTPGEKAKFEPYPHNPPEDQGDFEVWMNPKFVKAHDDFYEIEIESNLSALTSVEIDIEIPGYTLNDYLTSTYTNDDGTMRFHVPRIEERAVEEQKDVTFVVNAYADGSIETIDLYGENGENFEGELVEKTKTGKKIHYQFKLKDYIE